MKKLVLILAVLALYSCADQTLTKENTQPPKYAYDLLEVIVIDSCEYIYAPWGVKSTVFEHKANCKNHK